MKVALLPKKTRGEAVNFTLSLHFADEKSVFGKATGGSPAAMLMRGTTKSTRQEIEDTFDKLRAKVGVSGTKTARRDRADVSRATARHAAPDRAKCCASLRSRRRSSTAQARARDRRSKRRAPIRRRSPRARCAAMAIRIRSAIRAMRRRSTRKLARKAVTPDT